MILGKRRSSQRQSKTQAILATKALINKEISDEAIAKKEIEEKKELESKTPEQIEEDFNKLLEKLRVKRGKGLTGDFVIHSVLISKNIAFDEALKKFQDITNSKKKFYKEDKNYYSFRNIARTKFIPRSYRSKKINDDIILKFGKLKPT